MSRRAATWISRAILAVATIGVVASMPVWFAIQRSADRTSIVVIGDPSAPRVEELRAELARRPGDFLPDGPNVGFVLIFLLCIGWIAVGSVIVSRQPANWAGWLFVAVGLPLPLLSVAQSLVVYGARVPGADVPALGAWALLGEYVLYPIALIPLFFLLYPDGTLPGPGWRWAVRGLLGGVALSVVGFAVRPGPLNNWVDQGILYVNPLGVDAVTDVSGVVIAAGGILALASALSTVIAVRRRFRRAVGEERQQMRWLRFVATAAGVTFLAQWLLVPLSVVREFDEDLPIFDILFAATALILVVGIPVAYLVAIFRHGLWDLDLVIRKTVQYAILVVTLTVLGGIVLLGIPTLLFGVGADTPFVPVLALATLLSATFLWVRPRAARLADRVVYGRRATPYEVLSNFSGRVGDTYSIEDVLPRMTRLVAEATGATRADVWLRVGGALRPDATWPDDAPVAAPRGLVGDHVPRLAVEHAVEVRHRGELLGAITLEPAADDPIDPAKEALLRDLAAQAGLVLRNVRLIEELRASRRRLVAAQDEERRRLERDIHDGAQQQLVALGIKLRIADQLVERDPAKAREQLEQLQRDTQAAIEDLRDLARGIYPPVLADRGLAAALQAQARKAAIPVTVDADGIGRYPPAIEAAVYFSCLEALQNAAKYAGAAEVSVVLTQRDGALTFTVRDDGRGFEPSEASYGSGLQGITDRIDAIGGEFRVTSAPGSGTTLEGRIPLRGASPFG